MQVTAEDIKTFLSGAAIAISLISLYFTRVNWLQSNRPVVSAFITEHGTGDNMATAFDLVVANTGNRPAVRVRLHASHEEIASLVEAGANPNRFKSIEATFSTGSEIPLLRNGEELSTSFGAYIGASAEGPWLRYGAETNISITYQDLEGRTYESRQPLKVFAREGFGGGVWNDAKT